ncbi:MULTISPECIES: ABC transporter ATP-binding protein [Clostridia]|uniref:ABC transporter ATP-binding protein n=1 Tax=Clostridia TaxID=186801 RepID=UPI000EA0FFB1|nr:MULTISPECIES: ABC transporter ATP-binding protein [Clostridia]NBJ70292.1 ABC transporter ATP-binding protein [Roseburia sp. 1XD42-34]RKI76431.1 ABC transporter ATP-binding protein [Clostridium sp. 1xD42-85]
MEHVIELQHVHKSFGEFKLTDVSLQVKKGFVTGFIGGNGAGKSTIMKMILNLIQPDSGKVRVFGLDYQTSEKTIKEKIGFVFNDSPFYEELTLQEMKNLIAPCYRRWNDALFHHYCDQFDLPLKQRLKSFSDGMKMKASLAMALSHHAELLIMDEPTTNLDPVFRREFVEHLHEVMLDEGKTIFMATHIMSDLSSLADYITYIHRGEIIFSKGAHELEENFAIVRGGLELLDSDTEQYFLSIKRSDNGFEALTSNYKTVASLFDGEAIIEKANLEEIMYYSRGGK